jgi:hypothetical protein
VAKHTHYNALGAACYHFVPLWIETHGRLGKLFKDLVGTIGEVAEASSVGTFSDAQFVANALCELSVALCLWNALLEWAVAGFFARAVSSCFMPGQLVPCVDSEDVDG